MRWSGFKADKRVFLESKVPMNFLNVIAFIAILAWLIYWSKSMLRGFSWRADSIKSMLFVGCAWVGVISAGLKYFN